MPIPDTVTLSLKEYKKLIGELENLKKSKLCVVQILMYYFYKGSSNIKEEVFQVHAPEGLKQCIEDAIENSIDDFNKENNYICTRSCILRK